MCVNKYKSLGFGGENRQKAAFADSVFAPHSVLHCHRGWSAQGSFAAEQGGFSASQFSFKTFWMMSFMIAAE